MRLFSIIPQNLFSILASPNREIYMDALFVVYRFYKQEFAIRKDELVNMLIANLENRIYELAEEPGEEIGDASLSGRAYWLLRKLVSTGWLERDPLANSVEEYLALPDYSVKLMQVLYEIAEDKPKEYNSLVYSTYSNLSTALEERGDYLAEALLESYHLTDRLVDSLKSLLNNMRRYYLALQEQEEVRQVLREHFDRYQVLITDRIYHPLKTFDSVPRFRTRIMGLLRQWLADDSIMETTTKQLIRRGHYDDERTARDEVIRMLTFIMDQYNKMDGLLKEIDRKNASYTRASVERTQYLLNTSRDTRGKLIEVLKSLPKINHELAANVLEDLRGMVNLYEQSWVDEHSLYREPRKREFSQPEALRCRDPVSEEELVAEYQQLKQRINNSLSHTKVMQFIQDMLGDRQEIRSHQLRLEVTEDLLKLILAVVKADEAGVPYRVEYHDGYLLINGFRIPDLKIINKGGRNNVV